MAFKQFQLDELGTVTVYKRRGTNSLRLSVRPDGSLRVTIPAWSAYATGLQFARSRRSWIESHRATQTTLSRLMSGQAVGKAHRLHFVSDPTVSKPSARVYQTEVLVTFPASLTSGSPSVQTAARQACIRALRAEARNLLPQRLAQLAGQHDFNYGTVGVKQMKSRWGSCDQDKNIVLNLFLMQLPWHLIDYVLLHELTHTRVMQHGPRFWEVMESVEPRAKQLRKEIRTQQPQLALQS